MQKLALFRPAGVAQFQRLLVRILPFKLAKDIHNAINGVKDASKRVLRERMVALEKEEDVAEAGEGKNVIDVLRGYSNNVG